MIRRPPRSTPLYSSAASDVYKRQVTLPSGWMCAVGLAQGVLWNAARICPRPRTGLPGTRSGKQVVPMAVQPPIGLPEASSSRRYSRTIGPCPCSGVLPAQPWIAPVHMMSAVLSPGTLVGQAYTLVYSKVRLSVAPVLMSWPCLARSSPAFVTPVSIPPLFAAHVERFVTSQVGSARAFSAISMEEANKTEAT